MRIKRNKKIHKFNKSACRYAPYPMPTGSSGHATHGNSSSATVQQVQSAHVQQHQQQQQQQQQTQSHQLQAANAQQGVQSVNMGAGPYHQAAAAAAAAAYLPNAVDMSSFQNVDWSSMYGMGMYV